MRKLLFCFLCILAYVTINAQVEEYQPSTKTQILTMKPIYDSLSNFEYQNIDNYGMYVGQKLFFFECTEGKEKAYSNLFQLSKPDTLWIRHRKNPKPMRDFYIKESYGWQQDSLLRDRTPAKVIAGHTFLITNYYYDDNNLYFTLLSEENVELIFFLGRSQIIHFNFPPFIIMGYLEKMKEYYNDKRYIFYRPSYAKLYDLNSKDSIPTNTELKFNKIATLNYGSYKLPSIILNSQNNHTVAVKLIDYPQLDIFCSFSDFSLEKGSSYSMTDFIDVDILEKRRMAKEEEIARKKAQCIAEEKERLVQKEDHRKDCIKRFGKTMGEIIAEGKVRIGMTKDMCIAAWGDPEDINSTTTTDGIYEQWVYGLGNYLYFENGKLTTIQN